MSSGFQSEMVDLPINRLRTLSNFRHDDPYFFNNMTMKGAEDLLEENENKYALNGLDSCIKTVPSTIKYFEYLNYLDQEINSNKVSLKKEDHIEEERFFSQYSSLHTIIEVPNEKEINLMMEGLACSTSHEASEQPLAFFEDQCLTKTSTYTENNSPLNESSPILIKIKDKKLKKATLMLKKRLSTNNSSSIYKKH